MAALQVGLGDHRQEGVAMEAMPGAALEVVEAEFFLERLRDHGIGMSNLSQVMEVKQRPATLNGASMAPLAVARSPGNGLGGQESRMIILFVFLRASIQ
jgi:hypothetical protein